MNKIFTLGIIVLSSAVSAQTDSSGKVGINVEQPTETLDVNGSERVRKLYKVNDKVTTDNKEYKPNRTVVADANGVLGYVDGLPSAEKSTEEEKTIVVSRKCTNNSGEFGSARDTDWDSTMAVGDYEFRWWRSGPTPWTVNGNYFEMRNTKKAIRFNSWSPSENYHDNAEQDRGYIDAGVWTRFTPNFNNSISGQKLIIQYIVVGTGEIFRFTGYLYRQTKPTASEKVCYSVEQLANGFEDNYNLDTRSN